MMNSEIKSFEPTPENNQELSLENKETVAIESNPEAKHATKFIEDKTEQAQTQIQDMESSLDSLDLKPSYIETAKAETGFAAAKKAIEDKIMAAKQKAVDAIRSWSQKNEAGAQFSLSKFTELVEQNTNRFEPNTPQFTNPEITNAITALLNEGQFDNVDKALEIAKENGINIAEYESKLVHKLCESGSLEKALEKVISGNKENEQAAYEVINLAARQDQLSDERVIELIKRVNFLPDGRRQHVRKLEASTLLKNIILSSANRKGEVPTEALDLVYNGMGRMELNEKDDFARGEKFDKSEYNKHFAEFNQEIQAQLERLSDSESGEYMAMKDMYNTEQPMEAGYFNLKAMRELEEKSPGVVTKIYKDFGIRNFQRYPAEVLLNQEENKDDTETPYGVVLQAVSDHNANLSRDRIAFDKLFKDLQEQGFTMRISEAMQKREVATRLHGYDKKYGVNNKIQFLILGGHGQPGELNMGDSGKDHKDKIVKSDLNNPVIEKLNSYLDKDANIVMNSCLTGAPEGFAQTLSKQTDKRVTASTEVISDAEYQVSKNNGKIKLDVVYTKLGEAGKVTFDNPKS